MSYMAMHTDLEPLPIVPPAAWTPPEIDYLRKMPLPREIAAPDARLFDILHSRRSLNGGDVDDYFLGSLLWHSTQLHERRTDGRFGRWESRPTPSAGGLHPIDLMILPLAAGRTAGMYLDADHEIGILPSDPAAALRANTDSVKASTLAACGITIQFVADASRPAACYENWSSLVWRDAGALLATLGLVAAALGLTSLPLGRHGTNIVRLMGLDEPFIGVGAVHIGYRRADTE